jgi:hypothetical protein
VRVEPGLGADLALEDRRVEPVLLGRLARDLLEICHYTDSMLELAFAGLVVVYAVVMVYAMLTG